VGQGSLILLGYSLMFSILLPGLPAGSGCVCWLPYPESLEIVLMSVSVHLLAEVAGGVSVEASDVAGVGDADLIHEVSKYLLLRVKDGRRVASAGQAGQGSSRKVVMTSSEVAGGGGVDDLGIGHSLSLLGAQLPSTVFIVHT